MKTTLNEIRKLHLSSSNWDKLLAHLGKTKPDDEPLAVITILESNGFFDAVWCVNRLVDKRKRVKLACLFASEVKNLMPDTSRSTLAVASRYADGLATDEELLAARIAADSAIPDNPYAAPYAAWAATGDVAYHDSSAWAVSAAAECATADAALATTFKETNSWTLAARAAAEARKKMQAKQIEILTKFLEEVK